MVPSMLIALIALFVSFNFAPINAGAATLLDSLRSGSLPLQKLLNPSDASQPVDTLSLDPEWDIMHHQGGNSPWIFKEHGIVEARINPPPGCRVDQVHMVGMWPTFE